MDPVVKDEWVMVLMPMYTAFTTKVSQVLDDGTLKKRYSLQ